MGTLPCEEAYPLFYFFLLVLSDPLDNRLLGKDDCRQGMTAPRTVRCRFAIAEGNYCTFGPLPPANSAGHWRYFNLFLDTFEVGPLRGFAYSSSRAPRICGPICF